MTRPNMVKNHLFKINLPVKARSLLAAHCWRPSCLSIKYGS